MEFLSDGCRLLRALVSTPPVGLHCIHDLSGRRALCASLRVVSLADQRRVRSGDERGGHWHHGESGAEGALQTRIPHGAICAADDDSGDADAGFLEPR